MSVIPTRDQPALIARPVPVRHPVGPVPGGITGRDVVRILRKHKWMILLSVGIFTGLAVAGTWVWMANWPRYSAEALIQVNQPSIGGPLSGGNRLLGGDVMERLALAQAQLIKTKKTLTATIDEPAVRNTRWYKRISEGADLPDILRKLNESISVRTFRDRDLLSVTMVAYVGKGEDTSELALVVNTLVRKAVEVARMAARRGLDKTIKELKYAREMFQKEFEKVLKRKKAVVPKYIGRLESTIMALRGQVSFYDREVSRLTLAQAQYWAIIEGLKAAGEQGNLASSPQIQAIIQNDGDLRSLRAAEVNYSIQLDNALQKYGPKHPNVRALELRLSNVREQTKKQEALVTEKAIASVLQMRKNEQDAINAQLEGLRTRRQEEQIKLSTAEGLLNEMDELNAQEKDLKEEIRRIGKRLVDLDLQSRGETPIQLARQAEAPIEPYSPSWPLNTIVGVILGLMIGLGMAFVIELVDTSIKGPADIARRIDLPILGVIPHADDLEEEFGDVRLAFSTNPNSIMSEAFRHVRTCLLFSGPPEQRRSILVTSPLPEDGRGTVTMNLATAMASDGRKVLVVDANFRQPGVRELFPQCPEGGLSSALVGQANWRDLVREGGHNLYVMSSGPLPPNPAELLGSDQMRQLVGEMVEEFDQVLFDGAPCLVVSDPAVLSTMVDGVVLVIRAGSNTSGAVQRVRDLLGRVGARILGVVLNGMRTTAGGYLRKSYDTFYEYHEPRELPAKERKKVPRKPARPETPMDQSPTEETPADSGSDAQD